VRAEPVIGWDLGGAHLKAARLDAVGRVDRVFQAPCPLWEGMEHLHSAVRRALTTLEPALTHAVTMTGEMVDLFPNRSDGVARLATAMREALPGATLRFYAGGDRFVDAEQARGVAAQIGGANWEASAALVAARLEAALLIDLGSTTTDLVAVRGGHVCARGRSDAERLVAGELLYTGVVRTPLAALAGQVPFDGEWVPLMAEHFATTADVHRLTGQLPEGVDQQPTADGGEKTVAGSARRLARMVGRDVESAPLAAWRRLAAWLGRAQLRRIEDAADRLWSRELLSDEAPVVIAGAGRFLLTDLAARRGWTCIAFGRLLSGDAAELERASDCAPAVALAWLAQRGVRPAYGSAEPAGFPGAR
jgi:probable H4MPT-linked C1 transfer pathway protein